MSRAIICRTKLEINDFSHGLPGESETSCNMHLSIGIPCQYVEADMLSEKQVEIYKRTNGGKEPKDEKTSKLILNLNGKSKYIVHIRTLQFYLKHGLKLKKIHRAEKN